MKSNNLFVGVKECPIVEKSRGLVCVWSTYLYRSSFCMAFLCLYAFSVLYFSLKGTYGGHFQCEPLRDQTCFGSRLDYNFTTLDLVTDSDTQLDIEENLKKWEGLKFLSKCWSVLQPLLCQVYKPQCFNDNVTLPCREQCLATRKPCSVVERYKEQWPDFLQCERFPVGNCKGGSVSWIVWQYSRT